MDKEEQIAAIVAKLDLPAGVTIRKFEEADFPTIYKLSGKEGWNSPNISEEQNLEAWHNSWPVLVAVSEGEVIGHLRAMTDYALSTYIADILVAKEWRRKGLAGLLLEVCHQLTPRTLFVLMSVDESVKFYEREGFEHTIGFSKGWPIAN